MSTTKLHIDDFIEMLERDDPIERIAAYAGISVKSAMRRFTRLSAEQKMLIRKKRTNRPNFDDYFTFWGNGNENK